VIALGAKGSKINAKLKKKLIVLGLITLAIVLPPELASKHHETNIAEAFKSVWLSGINHKENRFLMLDELQGNRYIRV
jgi:hypothetical protein